MNDGCVGCVRGAVCAVAACGCYNGVGSGNVIGEIFTFVSKTIKKLNAAATVLPGLSFWGQIAQSFVAGSIRVAFLRKGIKGAGANTLPVGVVLCWLFAGQLSSIISILPSLHHSFTRLHSRRAVQLSTAVRQGHIPHHGGQ